MKTKPYVSTRPVRKRYTLIEWCVLITTLAIPLMAVFLIGWWAHG